MKLALTLLTAVLLLAANDSVHAADRPNIVLMVADDLGYNDLSCYGAAKIATPRIDALAGQGVRFTDAHSACAICIPSRYSILSGTYYFHAKCKGGQPTTAPAKRTEALLQGTKGIVLRQGDWIYFPKQGSLGYTVPEPEKPFGLPYAKMEFTNSDIDEHEQLKVGAPPEQLYNLATDVRQSKNLAAEQPERVRAMHTRFLELAGPAAGGRTEGRTQIKEE